MFARRLIKSYRKSFRIKNVEKSNLGDYPKIMGKEKGRSNFL